MSRRVDLRPGSRPARPGLGQPPALLRPGRGPRRQLPPRGPPSPGRAFTPPSASRSSSGPSVDRGARVLQPGDRPSRRGAPRDAGHDREPDRPVRGEEARGGGARYALRDLARHAVRRRRRRHLPPAEPGLGEDARLHHGGADVAALRRFRPPGRPPRHDGRGRIARGRREHRLLREPLPLQGRLLPLALLEVHPPAGGGPRLRGGARRHRAEADRGGAAARPRGRGRGEPGQGRLPRQHEPRDPDPDERRHRDGGAAARHAPRPRAAGVRASPSRTRRSRSSGSSTTCSTSRRSRRGGST